MRGEKMTGLETPAKEVPRDGWQRPLIIPPGGGKPEPYTRCTRFVDVLDDKYTLQKWMQRQVAVGLSLRSDLALAAATAANDPEVNKRDLDAICDDAREAAQGSAKATIGKAFHSLTERLDRGLSVGVVPDQYRAHLDAYEAATRHLSPIHIEQIMVLDEMRVAGTPDRIVTVEGMPGCYIADLKTGASTLTYGLPKVAMQLAVYAHSALYDVASGARADVDGLNLERGLVIALDSQIAPGVKPECRLLWVDLTVGWRGAQMCRQVWDWRKDTRKMSGEEDIPRKPAWVAPEKTTAIEVAIHHASTLDELTLIWSEAFKAGLWTDAYTEMAKARKLSLTE